MTIYRSFLAGHAVCIQHNFTTLQEELPKTDHATTLLKNLLDESNVSDIQRCSGTIRQKAKLLKILILKGQDACKQFFDEIKSETGMDREDLIEKMIKKNTDVISRGNEIFQITNIEVLNRYDDFNVCVYIHMVQHVYDVYDVTLFLLTYY